MFILFLIRKSFASSKLLGGTTTSSSNTTGALKVDGGVGIVKNLFVGGISELTGLDVSSGIATFAGAVDANSTLDVASTSVFNDDVSFIGVNAGVTSAIWDKSENTLNFKDHTKATWGTGNDLKLYHNGTNGVITNSSGDLYVNNNTDIIIKPDNDLFIKPQGGENGISVIGDGAVELYHNSLIRVGTTTEGIDITGTGALKIPVGTSAYRPTSPAQGDIRYNTTINTFEGHDGSAWGGLGGGTEIDNIVVTTSATGIGTFVHADYRSASVRVQITQGSNYQVGRYLMIHDGTTVTVVEEAAIATNSMLGTIDGIISGSNAVLRVTMGSASSATITTIIDKISV